MGQFVASRWITDSCAVVRITLVCEMTHPARYHRIDLSMTPTEASDVFSIPRSVAAYMLKSKRHKCGITRDELLREQIEPLIIRHGVTIDECAEAFAKPPAEP